MNEIEREVSIEQVDYNIDINDNNYTIEIDSPSEYIIELNEQGPQGLRGFTGNGISSFELTSSSGLVDTYTVTFTDGETTTINVTNGNGISSIAKTSTVGLEDEYTITFNNGDTETFTVTNGEKGDTGNGIASISLTSTSGLVDTYTITFTNGDTTTFDVTNGEEGNGISSINKTSTSGLVDTYTITFTNGDTETFTVTNGKDGQDGAAATISVGSTTTGAAGTSASVTNSGTSSAAVLDFVIPQGVKGDTGATGADGFSPTATVTKSGDTATITITDKNGTTTATVSDGSGASSVSELTDVDLTGLSNGDVLAYDSTSQEWKAEAQSGGVTDVEVNGESVVTDGVAEIDLTGYQEKLTAGTDLEIVEGSTLPTGYVQLKSITSTTTQYINTKISMTANYKAVIVGRLTQQPSSNFSTILGANNLNNDASTQGRFNIILGWGNAANGFYTENCIPSGDTVDYTYSSYPWDTETHTFTITVTPTRTTLNIDGTIDTISLPPAAWDTPTPLYLFARNIAADGSIGNITPFELEKIEQYQNDVLVFNGIPCKLGDIVGLYNTVTNEFLPNSGTGTFTAGQEVAPEGTTINFVNRSGYITSADLSGYATETWVGQQGYLTGITSSQVINALGYTPYNATNPNGYITATALANLANKDLSNLSQTGQDVIDNKADIDLSNITDTGKITIAHLGMPSNTYENLTLGASGTTYTAPADGWFSCILSVTTGTFNMSNTTASSSYGTMFYVNTTSIVKALLPVRKNDGMLLQYTAAATQTYKTLRFIYAVGSESEAT